MCTLIPWCRACYSRNHYQELNYVEDIWLSQDREPVKMAMTKRIFLAKKQSQPHIEETALSK